jgi:hypothetical protein
MGEGSSLFEPMTVLSPETSLLFFLGLGSVRLLSKQIKCLKPTPSDAVPLGRVGMLGV